MDWLVGISCALVLCWLLWLVVRLTIRYSAGQRSLRITLAGFTVRRVQYADITRLSQSTARVNWFNTERWSNTSRRSTRNLLVYRKTGLFRRLLITPKNRENFRDELAQAIRRSTGNEAFDTEVHSDTERIRNRRYR